MGILKEGINEVIATTRNNAAPIGIIKNDSSFEMVLFRGTHTFEHVVREGWVVANIVHDSCIYVKTAFSDLLPSSMKVEIVGGIRMQVLISADAWIAFTTSIKKETDNAVIITLHMQKEEILNPGVWPVNRGFNSIIEGSVHGTRYLLNRDPELKKLIFHHASLVRRCGGNRDKEALDLLMNYLGLSLD